MKETYSFLEKNVRLSESKIWKYQRRYFEERGPKAWKEEEVPSYGTSNSYAARCQAELILSLLKDLAIKKGKIRILELGAGSGKFAHLLLRSLERLLSRPLRSSEIQYVLSDFTESNLSEYPVHPSLGAWFDAGLMDCAHYDLEGGRPVHLRKSGEILQEEADDVLIVIANYVFDGVPQDLFETDANGLREVLVSTTHNETHWNEEDPYNLRKLKVHLTNRIESVKPYTNASWNEVLQVYETEKKDLLFSLPVAALLCMDDLSSRFKNCMFLICDKGTTTLSELDLSRPQGPVEHGSLSAPVNFHSIGIWARNRNWQTWEDKMERDYLHLNVYTNINAKLPILEQCYTQMHRFLCIDDYVHLRRSWKKFNEEVALEELLACLKTSDWDPKVFSMLYEKIINRLDEGPIHSSHTKILRQGLSILRKNHFFESQEDLLFCIGTLYGRLGSFPEAISTFQDSLELYGENLHTSFNLALCLIESRQVESGTQILGELRMKYPKFNWFDSVGIENELESALSIARKSV